MTDEKQFPRVTGYIIIILFLLLIGSSLVMILNYYIAQTKTMVIYFPKIGELKIEEPLMLNGMPVGTIVSYDENVYEGVSVTVAMHRNVKIHQGYEIYCADVGLFGTKREIVLINGPESAPEVKSTNSLNGSYFIGITEVISSIWKFQNAMNSMSSLFHEHLSGDAAALKMISTLQQMSVDSEKIGAKLSSINTLIGVDIPKEIDTIASMTTAADSVQSVFRAKIPGIRKDLQNEISTLDSIVTTVHNLIGQVTTATEKVESIEKKDSMEAVIAKLQSMEKRFDMIREDAHRLLLILRKYED